MLAAAARTAGQLDASGRLAGLVAKVAGIQPIAAKIAPCHALRKRGIQYFARLT
jgi:hypothetical protein